jgi:hypothetical protein
MMDDEDAEKQMLLELTSEKEAKCGLYWLHE